MIVGVETVHHCCHGTSDHLQTSAASATLNSDDIFIERHNTKLQTLLDVPTRRSGNSY